MAENLILPSNLHSVTRICGKGAYHSLRGVRVAHRDGGYRIEASDGRRLVRIDGDNAGDPAKFPSVPALDAAPNGAASALIPAEVFEKACKDVPKQPLADAAGLAVRLGKEVSTLVTVNADGHLIRQPKNVEGKFPDTEAVMPRGTPTARVRVNAALLAELIQVAAQFAAEGDVTIDLFDAAPGTASPLSGLPQPICLTARRKGQEFVGLLVPLCTVPA